MHWWRLVSDIIINSNFLALYTRLECGLICVGHTACSIFSRMLVSCVTGTTRPPTRARSMEEEKVLRKKTQVFIFEVCKFLKAKSLVMAAAMTICQRYFAQVSFRRIVRIVSFLKVTS